MTGILGSKVTKTGPITRAVSGGGGGGTIFKGTVNSATLPSITTTSVPAGKTWLVHGVCKLIEAIAYSSTATTSTHAEGLEGGADSGTGGGTEYKGRDMVGAHNGLNISEAEFLSAIDDILFVLDANKVDRVSRNELLATLYSMKDAVIKQ